MLDLRGEPMAHRLAIRQHDMGQKLILKGGNAALDGLELRFNNEGKRAPSLDALPVRRLQPVALSYVACGE